MTATSDDNQPTAAVGDVDDTAVVAEGPRTVAAEQFSEPPTTIVPDVEPTRAAELAWSSEARDGGACRQVPRMAWAASVVAVSGVAVCERRGCRVVLGNAVSPGGPRHRFAYGVRTRRCAAGSCRTAIPTRSAGSEAGWRLSARVRHRRRDIQR